MQHGYLARPLPPRFLPSSDLIACLKEKSASALFFRCLSFKGWLVREADAGGVFLDISFRIRMPTLVSIDPSRWRFALIWAGRHLMASVLAAALSALLVFLVWYPEPWRQMLGVAEIFGLIVAVDVVCGPLLTLVLANPRKLGRTLLLDLSLVALVQVAALGYGMWSVFVARPVVVAFEVDRFVVVTANEVLVEQLHEAPFGLQNLSCVGVRFLATRPAKNADEQLKSIELSMSGVTSAMRPGWWRPYDAAVQEIDRAARPLSELVRKRPEQRNVLNQAVQETGLAMSELKYLPLTSSRQTDWVILLNGVSRVVGYAQVDGFD